MCFCGKTSVNPCGRTSVNPCGDQQLNISGDSSLCIKYNQQNEDSNTNSYYSAYHLSANSKCGNWSVIPRAPLPGNIEIDILVRDDNSVILIINLAKVSKTVPLVTDHLTQSNGYNTHRVTKYNNKYCFNLVLSYSSDNGRCSCYVQKAIDVIVEVQYCNAPL